jgi:DNA-directed RNA polymerase subunit beta'
MTELAQPEEPPRTGPEAIAYALQNLDLDALEEEQKKIIASKKKTKRPRAVAILNAIRGMRKNEVSPSDLLVHNVPVLPPQFRPFSVAGGTFIAGDANELYKELIGIRDAYNEERSVLGDKAAGKSRMAMYDAVRAVYGYGDPVEPKTKSRGVSGFLKQVTGTNPKLSWFSSKMIGKPQDNVSRSVISINPELTLDEIGIPEDHAWSMYAPHIQRRLVRSGMRPSEALKAVRERTADAKKALDVEIEDRPVMYSRAPAWHKYNFLAGRAKLVDGDSIMVNPLVTGGLNADFDGDTLNVHVPASDGAVKDAKEILMPSKMLFSVRDPDRVMPQPKHEQILGLFTAGARPAKETHRFNTEQEALDAINKGLVRLSDEVEIGEESKVGPTV